jgi:hypothetical protein
MDTEVHAPRPPPCRLVSHCAQPWVAAPSSGVSLGCSFTHSPEKNGICTQLTTKFNVGSTLKPSYVGPQLPNIVSLLSPGGLCLEERTHGEVATAL